MADVGWMWAQVAQAALVVLFVEWEAGHEQDTRTWFPDEPPMACEGKPALEDYVDAVGFIRDMLFQEDWRFAGQHSRATILHMIETQTAIYTALQQHLEAAAVAAPPPHWRPLRFDENDG